MVSIISCLTACNFRSDHFVGHFAAGSGTGFADAIRVEALLLQLRLIRHNCVLLYDIPL
jgi:hypothetical protein